jgi:hypothetical protein
MTMEKSENKVMFDVCLYSDCPISMFRCSDGTCVFHELVCDGRFDCSDGSDETIATCGKCVATVLIYLKKIRIVRPKK